MAGPLARLLNSNKKWADDVCAHDSEFFHNCAKGQTPKVLWIGCSDSRVPESVVTVSKPGDIFVHRNIANQFHYSVAEHPDDTSALSVLEFAVAYLKVEYVVVVGHTQCGGAAACSAIAADSSKAFPSTSPLNAWLGPLVSLAKTISAGQGDPLRPLVDANVRKQVENIRKTPVVKTAGIPVKGWVFELETGKLVDLEA